MVGNPADLAVFPSNAHIESVPISTFGIRKSFEKVWEPTNNLRGDEKLSERLRYCQPQTIIASNTALGD